MKTVLTAAVLVLTAAVLVLVAAGSAGAKDPTIVTVELQGNKISYLVVGDPDKCTKVAVQIAFNYFSEEGGISRIEGRPEGCLVSGGVKTSRGIEPMYYVLDKEGNLR